MVFLGEMLFLVGLGVSGLNSLTREGLTVLESCDRVFFEGYTSVVPGFSVVELEGLIGKSVEVLDRSRVESDFLVGLSAGCDVGLVVVGDPLSATTHVSLVLDCFERGVGVRVVHSSSVLTVVGRTGLQLYKFGKVGSVPFSGGVVSCRRVLEDNLSIGAHSLFLLDLDPVRGLFLTVSEALDKLGLGGGVFVVVCSRLCASDERIVFSTVSKVKELDSQGVFKPPCCVIVPGELHFLEEEFLNRFRV